jgi:hypothetical protein
MDAANNLGDALLQHVLERGRAPQAHNMQARPPRHPGMHRLNQLGTYAHSYSFSKFHRIGALPDE